MSILVCVLLTVAIRSIRWKGESYILTKDTLVIRRDFSILGVKEKAYPYDAIVSTSVHQTWFTRHYNAGSIHLQFTAKSNMSDVTLTHITNPSNIHQELQRRISLKSIAHVSIHPQQ